MNNDIVKFQEENAKLKFKIDWLLEQRTELWDKLYLRLKDHAEDSNELMKLREEVEQLRIWKKKQIETWSPVLEYMHDNDRLNEGMRVGDNISKEVLVRCKEYFYLKTHLAEAKEHLEYIRDSSGGLIRQRVTNFLNKLV